jgi:hypothetical protein
MGRWHWARVLLLVIITAFLTWYGRQEASNPFAGKMTVSVRGGAGGYAVSCFAGRDAHVVSELRIRRAAAGDAGTRAADSAGMPAPGPERPSAVTEERVRMTGESSEFKDAYPFGDNVRATLLTFGRAAILVCDSAIFAPHQNAVLPQFREKLELLIIPSAGEEDILRIRNLFRPRLTAVIPPCNAVSAPNVICETTGRADGGFYYSFVVKSGKLNIVQGI